MAAVLDVPITGHETSSIAVSPPVPSSPVSPSQQRFSEQFLKNIFKPGQSGNPAGRPVGSKNRITPQEILKRKELRITKHYVERTAQSDPVLIDAMKRILPVAEAGSSSGHPVILVIAANALPALIGDAADPPATATITHVVDTPSIAETPTG